MDWFQEFSCILWRLRPLTSIDKNYLRIGCITSNIYKISITTSDVTIQMACDNQDIIMLTFVTMVFYRAQIFTIDERTSEANFWLKILTFKNICQIILVESLIVPNSPQLTMKANQRLSDWHFKRESNFKRGSNEDIEGTTTKNANSFYDGHASLPQKKLHNKWNGI